MSYQFGHLIPLFGNTELISERAIDFYLQTLYHCFTETNTVGIFKEKIDNATEGSIPQSCMAKNFNDFASTKDFNHGVSLHHSWYTFKSLFEEHMKSLNKDVDKKKKIHEFIKEHGNSMSLNSDKSFDHSVILAHIQVTPPNKQLNCLDLDDFSFKTDLIEIFTRDIFVGSADPNILIKYLNKKFEFDYRLSDELIRSIMSRAGNTEINTDYWDQPDVIEDYFFRTKRNPSKLYKLDEDGKQIDVDKNSQLFLNSSNSNNVCKNVGVNNSDRAKCSEYLTKCINNDNPANIEKCKVYLLDNDFWENIRDEVKNMLPVNIVTTLDQFGFKTSTFVNIDGESLLRYQSVGQWIKDLNDHVGQDITLDELKKIASNYKLVEYLKQLVNRVNANPAILNKAYSGGKTLEDDLDFPFENWSLYNLGMRAKSSNPSMNLQSMLLRQTHQMMANSSALKLATFHKINVLNNNIVRYGMIVGGGLMQPLSFNQNGGGMIIQTIDNSLMREKERENDRANMYRQHPQISTTLIQNIEKLKRLGKNFDQSEEAKLMKELKAYELAENKLLRSVRYVSKYADLMDYNKTYDRTNLLTMSHLQAFIDERNKYFGRVDEKQRNIMDIMTLLLGVKEDVINASNTNQVTERDV